MGFFGIGIWEIVLILVLVLIIWGPGRIVEIGTKLGRLARNLKRLTSDLSVQLNKELEVEDKKPPSSAVRQKQRPAQGDATGGKS